MTTRPKILVTNDDGVNSRGIKIFSEMLSAYGQVTVVAPDDAQSGKSASINLETPLYLKHAGIRDGIDWWSFSGSPVSCVKVAMNEVFTSGSPDYVFSGINIGSNTSVAAIYSGTLGACIEGTIYDIPSVGFSVCTHDINCDLSAVQSWGKSILDKIFSPTFKMKQGTYLNINFPYLPSESIKGVKLVRRGLGRWIREFEEREDPANGKHLWMQGCFEDLEGAGGKGDHTAIAEGYITIVPLKTDFTDTEELERLSKIWSI